MSELPDGWSATPLGNLLAAIEAGRSFKCTERPAKPDEWGVIKVSAMTWQEFNEAENKTVLSDHHADPRFEIRPGDLLFSRANTVTYVGAVVQVGETRPRLLLSDKSLRLVPRPDVSPRWLLYYLRSQPARRYLESLATGTSDSMRNISQANLRSLPVPVAPLREQERIVAGIEEQFSRLDAGAAALKRLRQNLKRMRAAVLQAAVAGKLVPQDPSDQSARDWLGVHGRIADDKAIGLRPGWARATVGALKTWSLYGPRFTSDDYVAAGVPVLRTTDITPSGRILVDQAPKLALSETDLRKYRVEVGDILITRTGSIGTLAYIKDDVPAIPGAYLILYRFGLPIEFSEFLFYHFQSPAVQAKLINKSAGIGRPNLNAPSIDATVVDFPPFAEAVKIVTEVKRILSSIEALEAELNAAETRQHRLREAILTAAFSGKLAAQDANDEPASVLLERIAVEGASSNGHKPKLGRKPRALQQEVTV
jgi:type I restriction enzyme S subunit